MVCLLTEKHANTTYVPSVPAQPLLSRVAGTRYSKLCHRYLRGEMADEQDWRLGDRGLR